MSGTDPMESAYWPAGWSRDRLVNSSSSELLDIPDDSRDRMYESLRGILGPEGFKALLGEMSTNYKARLLAAEEAAGVEQQQQDLPPHLRAPFLATLQRLYPGEGGVGPWGFVVYRLAYGDERRWEAFRTRWDEIVRDRLRNYDGVPGVAGAVEQLEFRWIEERELEGASLGSIASHYRGLLAQRPLLPPGLAHPLCLAITSSSLSSVLSSPLPSSAPLPDRKSLPFAVAIDKSLNVVLPSDQDVETEGDRAELEGSRAPQTFNVAVESLLDELFRVVGGDVMSLDELAAGVGPKQVWVSGGGRHGVHEMEN